MLRRLCAMGFGLAITISSFASQQDPQEKHVDIQSSAGDLHVGTDADARKAGLPLYPGARLTRDEDNRDAVNLGILTEDFGMKLVVAKYESDDAPAKILVPVFYTNRYIVASHLFERRDAFSRQRLRPRLAPER